MSCAGSLGASSELLQVLRAGLRAARAADRNWAIEVQHGNSTAVELEPVFDDDQELIAGATSYSEVPSVRLEILGPDGWYWWGHWLDNVRAMPAVHRKERSPQHRRTVITSVGRRMTSPMGSTLHRDIYRDVQKPLSVVSLMSSRHSKIMRTLLVL